jgi:hypothetical protein
MGSTLWLNVTKHILLRKLRLYVDCSYKLVFCTVLPSANTSATIAMLVYALGVLRQYNMNLQPIKYKAWGAKVSPAIVAVIFRS